MLLGILLGIWLTPIVVYLIWCKFFRNDGGYGGYAGGYSPGEAYILVWPLLILMFIYSAIFDR